MIIIVLAITGGIVMWLWNLLIPDLFHGPVLTYWDALGLLVLARLLVGIRGRRMHWFAPWSGHARRRAKRRWKQQWYNNWADGAPWDWGNGPGFGDWNQRRRESNQGRHARQRMSREEREAARDEWQAAKDRWKAECSNRMHEWWKKWEAMSPEERQQYRKDHHGKHGYRDNRDSAPTNDRVYNADFHDTTDTNNPPAPPPNSPSVKPDAIRPDDPTKPTT